MALTKVTGQVINDTTGLVVGVTTVGGGISATDGFFSGIVTAVGDASFSGNVSVGGTLTYEDVTNIDAVGLVTARNGIVVGSGITLSKDGDIFATGVTTATTFSGSGASLTNLNASNLASGTVPSARLGSGTASSSTFLAGDSTFKTVSGTTINNNADNRVITGSGTANTLEGEANLTFSGSELVADSSMITAQNTGAGSGASKIQLQPYGTDGYINCTASGNLYTRMGTSFTTRTQIDSSGNFTVSSGNLVIGTSGKGIDFSATSDGGGSSSNVSELLDDYEEGNFVPYMAYSPTSNDPAYSFQSGFYVKIGKLVTFQARINLTSAGTGSANLKITNFPFAPTPSSGGLSNPMVTIKPVVGVDVGGDREIFAQFEGGNSSLVLYTFGIESSSDYASFTQSNIDNDAQVAIFGHYYTAS